MSSISVRLRSVLRRHWSSFSYLGLVCAALFFAASLTPSLLPRHYVVQGLLSGLAIAGILSREAMLDPSSSISRQQVAVLKPNFDTAMAFLWQTTPGNDRTHQIEAGRDYVRLNLAATGLGVSVQPFSQALQEYPEMQPHFLRLRDELGIAKTETLQMFVRLGYGPDVKAAPRWPLDTRIMNA